jgi:hypothetical protein
MRLPRISIKSLMGYVVLVGIGLAAVARPNSGWGIVLSAIAFTALATSVLGVIFRRGPTRAWWVGFAVFGWSFFGLVVLSISESLHGEISFGMNLFWLYRALYAVASVDREQIDEIIRVFGIVDRPSQGSVAVSLIGLAFAVLGGWVARAFAGTEIPPA